MNDYHIHTVLCGHAQGDIRDYCEQALTVGLTEIGFSDHFPVNYQPRYSAPIRQITMREEEISNYLEMVNSVKAAYPQLKIKTGFEIDLLPQENLFFKNYSSLWPQLDYCIGSVHFIEEWGFDQPEQQHYLSVYGISGLWKRYFRLMKQMIDHYAGQIDIIGHFDLPKKLGWSMPASLREEAGLLLDLIKSRDLVLEVNTSGFDKVLHEPYPSLFLLQEAFQRGIDITFSSDAHKPEEVGRHFQEMRSKIMAIGYDKTVLFSHHQKEYQQI